MSVTTASAETELFQASDETIEDALRFADPMVLRGLLYQLTGDEELRSMPVKMTTRGLREVPEPASEVELAMIREKAAAFLTSLRDSRTTEVSPGPPERLRTSLGIIVGKDLPEEDMGLYEEDLAIDPWARGLDWSEQPSQDQLQRFTVTVIGAGMGGLNAAVQLKRAGIPFTVIEKNADVGGTWFENRYPGVRVDTLTRAYTNLYGVHHEFSNPFSEGPENEKYFNWVADEFGVREDIVFDTEVTSVRWDEDDSMWEIRTEGPTGPSTVRSTAVITAVGFLNRPNLPDIDGMDSFSGRSWHTAQWPADADLSGKRVAVIGTGCTGYQLIDRIAGSVDQLTIFQRRPQWLFPVPGYTQPSAPQVRWLDRNFPYYVNFMRFLASFANVWALSILSEVDPDFDHPDACSEANLKAREAGVAFLESKLKAPELVGKMTPPHPPISARPVLVDPESSVLDAIVRDNVSLVSDGIRRVTETGIEALDGCQYDVDVIIYATGFRATEYLFPMTVEGVGGRSIEDAWADGGARAYVGCMVPAFPNFWMLYGPNTNAGLNAPTLLELGSLHALQCIERLILDDKDVAEVSEEAFWRYNELLDRRNAQKVWSDPRGDSYYGPTDYGRSTVMNPFDPPEIWRFLRHVNFDDVQIR